MEAKEVLARVEELLSAGDMEAAEAFIEEQAAEFSGDLEEQAVRIACRVGCVDYVDKYAAEYDLDNLMTEYAGTREVKDTLFNLGAEVNWDDYADKTFAVETVNYEVLSFREEFQEKVFKKALKVAGLTKKKAARLLEEDEACDFEMPEPLDAFALSEICEMLQAEAEDGEIILQPFGFLEGDGSQLVEVIEALGWKTEYEGHEYGVQFID